MPANCMREWLRVPEFIDAVNALLDAGSTIDNQKVLEICTAIINEKSKDREANKEFCFQTLRCGTNHMKRALDAEAIPSGGFHYA